MQLAQKIKTGFVNLVFTILIFSGILGIFKNVEEAWILSFTAILIFFLINQILKKYDIALTTEIEISILLFIISALYAGEVLHLYARFYWWDTALHAFSGMLITFVFYSILHLQKAKNKINLNNFAISLFALSVSMTFGTLFEIFEFFMDNNFGTEMVKAGGIRDTIIDLTAQFIGALTVMYFSNTKLLELLKNRIIALNTNS